MTKIFNEETEVIGTVDVGGDVVVEGGVEKITVTDENQLGLLTQIVKELKIVNLHLAFINSTFVTDSEVE